MIPPKDSFEQRHNGTHHDKLQPLLERIQTSSLDDLINEIIPKGIRLKEELNLPQAVSEQEYLKEIGQIASKNDVFDSFIGMGYTDTIMPSVILRNILENPGWYTAYTPYQAEIAQGRMEALINYQTMISDLTGMELANASLLDEATAVAEGVTMLYDARPRSKKEATTCLVSSQCHPQVHALLETRTQPLGIELVIQDPTEFDVTNPDVFAMVLAYPDSDGQVRHISPMIDAGHEHDVKTVVTADLLSLVLLTPPGEQGADVVVGSAQRFGVPMGFGGPHAAFFATRSTYQRKIPGRIIGATKDVDGNPAYRMALQTREQHIRREKATSNICTAQVLLAVISGFYGVWHGPDGLKRIAARVHGLTAAFADGLKQGGCSIRHEAFFDTLRVKATPDQAAHIRKAAEEASINLRYFDNGDIGVTFDEAKEESHVEVLWELFHQAGLLSSGPELSSVSSASPLESQRTSSFMDHEVFHQYHTEHEMLRYMKRLENKDLSLTHSMISLGSCTMKLNATTEMIPVTWKAFGGIHPFAPSSQIKGYTQLFDELSTWLEEITGFDSVSLQPNSGAQGEYTGLMVIREYHRQRGDHHRNVAIIPSSAHGTNPASAVMAGMHVVVTQCDEQGNIDFEDLKKHVEEHSDNLSALMVTYPSTHGVFEEHIQDICALIHEHGGKVYMDGANMNAQVGLTSPAAIGADVCHLNLHKTFCIPHGGGGPGMGPIGVTKDLAPYLPGHPLTQTGGELGISAVSAAPWGSASILTISHAYIRMMGPDGLTQATKLAILNANYMMERLKDHYPVLYRGKTGRSAHEFILDIRGFKSSAGIEATDIAKRLMDYGFHAPTMSFPVAGTLMIEPTESESQAELDRFCDAMIAIREEIRAIESGSADAEDNVLKHAPHTQSMALSDHWSRPYSRKEAVFPAVGQASSKFWPSVRRVDDAFGDRNLMCTCLPMSAYEEA
ncbi:MAG: aminomethyl-transferring glycine dehydrogenase [Balneolaceae bacterium]|nr:aminomethyl-transferring glycine dehydrogenase [Balneolaceae bacterium]